MVEAPYTIFDSRTIDDIHREIQDDTFSFRKKDKEILQAICEEKKVPVTLISKLLDTELQMDGMSRRAKIQSRIDEIFHEDWRSKEEVNPNKGDSGSSNDSPQTHP